MNASRCSLQDQDPVTVVRNGCAPRMIVLAAKGRQTPLSRSSSEVCSGDGNLDSGVGTFMYGHPLRLVRNGCALRVMLIQTCDCVTVTHVRRPMATGLESWSCDCGLNGLLCTVKSTLGGAQPLRTRCNGTRHKKWEEAHRLVVVARLMSPSATRSRASAHPCPIQLTGSCAALALRVHGFDDRLVGVQLHSSPWKATRSPRKAPEATRTANSRRGPGGR